jgi:hypothetical protein
MEVVFSNSSWITKRVSTLKKDRLFSKSPSAMEILLQLLYTQILDFPLFAGP